jgi:RNA polymerase sigma-70 factor, ECF subfamily
MSSSADQPAPGAGHDPAVAARVEQLYANHAALVRSVCCSLLRDRLDAEDAVQQTFLSAQRALASGTFPRNDAAWLATIARHECLARVRARMREALPIELENGDSAPDAHTAAVRKQEGDELRKALAELPAQQREAILLREVRGLSYHEVASSLSVTTSAVESLLFRARRSLQTRLREALAALSPGWVPSLREFAVRIGSGGGVEAPMAAKVAAVGVGTALFAGGALAPTMMGVGHAPNSVHYASRPSRPARRHIVHTMLRVTAVHPWRAFAGAQMRGGDRHTNGVSNTLRVVSDVVRSSDGSESKGSTEAGAHYDDANSGTPFSNRSTGSTGDSSKMDDGRNDGIASSSGTYGATDDSSKTDDGSSDDSWSPTTTTGTTTATTTTATTTTTYSTTTTTTTND